MCSVQCRNLLNLNIVLCILRIQKLHKEAQKIECCYQSRAVIVCVLNSAEYIAFNIASASR